MLRVPAVLRLKLLRLLAWYSPVMLPVWRFCFGTVLFCFSVAIKNVSWHACTSPTTCIMTSIGGPGLSTSRCQTVLYRWTTAHLYQLAFCDASLHYGNSIQHRMTLHYGNIIMGKPSPVCLMDSRSFCRKWLRWRCMSLPPQLSGNGIVFITPKTSSGSRPASPG